MNGIYAVDARVVLIPYKLDMVILDAVTVDVMMAEMKS